MKIDLKKIIFILIAALISVSLICIISSCSQKTSESITQNESIKATDCDKSNAQIRQENRTERERLKQESKQFNDSLNAVIKFWTIEAELKSDSLRSSKANNRIDSRQQVKQSRIDWKWKSDSLDNMVKMQKLRISGLEDSLKFNLKNNKVDSKQSIKENRANKNFAKKDMNCWTWWDKIKFALLMIVIGYVLNWIVTILFALKKLPINKK